MSFFDIDIQTAIKLCAIADVSMVVPLLLYCYEEGSKRALSFFVSGQLMKAIGLVLISLREVIPLLLSAHVGNILFFGGAALEMFAFALVCGSRFRFKTLFIPISVIGAILFISIDFLPLDRASSGSCFVLVASLVIGSLYSLGGISLIGATYSSLLRKALGAIFIVLALCFFSRGYPSLTEHDMVVFTPGAVQFLSFIALLITTTVSGLGFILVMHEESDKALKLAAITDSLTTLANRRRFNEVLSTEFCRLKRSGAPLSLIILDVDHFKRFNDCYGHVQGDECLKRISQAIKTVVCRASDLAARYGGEEFVVVAPETDAIGVMTLAENIRCAVEKLAIPHEENTAASHVTVSLGVVTRYGAELETPENFIDLADHALYEAKQAGRNRTKVMLTQKADVCTVPGLVRLVWKDIAESGNAKLDEEHKALFDQANQLLSAVLEGRPKQECRSILDQTLEAIAAHFKDEEAILIGTSFPRTEHHIQCHKELLKKAHAMSKRFDRNELSIGELFSFLAHEVVVQHIFSEDRKFFPYLEQADQRYTGLDITTKTTE